MNHYDEEDDDYYDIILQNKYPLNKTCVICNVKFRGYGHNPYPLKPPSNKGQGRCCDICNMTVISYRVKMFFK